MVESGIESGTAPLATPGDDIVTDVVVLGGGLAGLTMAGILSLAVVGLVLFCQFVWFR